MDSFSSSETDDDLAYLKPLSSSRLSNLPIIDINSPKKHVIIQNNYMPNEVNTIEGSQNFASNNGFTGMDHNIDSNQVTRPSRKKHRSKTKAKSSQNTECQTIITGDVISLNFYHDSKAFDKILVSYHTDRPLNINQGFSQQSLSLKDLERFLPLIQGKFGAPIRKVVDAHAQTEETFTSTESNVSNKNKEESLPICQKSCKSESAYIPTKNQLMFENFESFEQSCQIEESQVFEKIIQTECFQGFEQSCQTEGLQVFEQSCQTEGLQAFDQTCQTENLQALDQSCESNPALKDGNNTHPPENTSIDLPPIDSISQLIPDDLQNCILVETNKQAHDFIPEHPFDLLGKALNTLKSIRDSNISDIDSIHRQHDTSREGSPVPGSSSQLTDVENDSKLHRVSSNLENGKDSEFAKENGSEEYIQQTKEFDSVSTRETRDNSYREQTTPFLMDSNVADFPTEISKEESAGKIQHQVYCCSSSNLQETFILHCLFVYIIYFSAVKSVIYVLCLILNFCFLFESE